ncbi:MAG: glutathione S-transferase family protein [Burkholderiales bacterium]|nr:glutathione S-transferase family protein [Burkholderiales bacterium]
MSEFILHHYPTSPISEKIRVVMGIKKLTWRSVQIPNLPPKPDVIPLSGGYRRTPIMQIGADIFCDSQTILAEIENQYPANMKNAGLAQVINHWCDNLFAPIVKVAIATSSSRFPEDFLKDRQALFLGAYPDIDSVTRRIPHYTTQVRAQMSWANAALHDSGGFLLGEAPSVPDASLFALVWFIRRRWENGEEFLTEFPDICRWEKAITDIGHGTYDEMTSQEALDVANNSDIAPESNGADSDDQIFSKGNYVRISFDGKSGEQPVSGRIHSLERNRISLIHTNDRVGTVCIHFPKVGYLIEHL